MHLLLGLRHDSAPVFPQSGILPQQPFNLVPEALVGSLGLHVLAAREGLLVHLGEVSEHILDFSELAFVLSLHSLVLFLLLGIRVEFLASTFVLHVAEHLQHILEFVIHLSPHAVEFLFVGQLKVEFLGLLSPLKVVKLVVQVVDIFFGSQVEN